MSAGVGVHCGQGNVGCDSSARAKLLACAETTLCAKYNDIESVKEIFAANKDEIAGVILEPVVGNSGFIAPTQEFLEVDMTPLHDIGIGYSSRPCVQPAGCAAVACRLG
jgi:glutamate-1-semialdehyde aminotransferase